MHLFFQNFQNVHVFQNVSQNWFEMVLETVSERVFERVFETVGGSVVEGIFQELFHNSHWPDDMVQTARKACRGQ